MVVSEKTVYPKIDKFEVHCFLVFLLDLFDTFNLKTIPSKKIEIKQSLLSFW